MVYVKKRGGEYMQATLNITATKKEKSMNQRLLDVLLDKNINIAPFLAKTDRHTLSLRKKELYKLHKTNNKQTNEYLENDHLKGVLDGKHYIK